MTKTFFLLPLARTYHFFFLFPSYSFSFHLFIFILLRWNIDLQQLVWPNNNSPSNSKLMAPTFSTLPKEMVTTTSIINQAIIINNFSLLQSFFTTSLTLWVDFVLFCGWQQSCSSFVGNLLEIPILPPSILPLPFFSLSLSSYKLLLMLTRYFPFLHTLSFNHLTRL